MSQLHSLANDMSNFFAELDNSVKNWKTISEVLVLVIL